MIVSLGTACQRLKSALGMDTCSELMAFVGTSSLLGQKRCDSHLGNGYVRDLRCSAVYVYLAQGMVGVRPIPHPAHKWDKLERCKLGVKQSRG